MAIVMSWSFDGPTSIYGAWDFYSISGLVSGRHGNAGEIDPGGGMSKNISSADATLGSALLSLTFAGNVHQLADVTGTIVANVSHIGDGRFEVSILTPFGTFISDPSRASIDIEEWYFVESTHTLVVTIVAASPGFSTVTITYSATVRINNQAINLGSSTTFSATTMGTLANANLPGIVFLNAAFASPASAYFDDVYITNDNTFVGDCYVHPDGTVEVVAGVEPQVTQELSEIGENIDGPTLITQTLDEIAKYPANLLYMTQDLCEVAIGLRGMSYATMAGRARGISPAGSASIGT